MTLARHRQLAILWVGLSVASSAFPIVAGLLDANSLPTWLGPLAVALAAVTALLGFYLLSAAGRSISDSNAAFRYRVLQVCSTVMAIGLAWRAWPLVTVLPAWSPT